jgi:hypothetical protein
MPFGPRNTVDDYKLMTTRGRRMINGCLSRERRAGLTAAGRKAVGKLRRLTLLAVPVMFGVAAFSAVIDASDQFIYVSGERSTPTATASANVIHTLKVAPDGTLSEPFSPTVLPISGVARAQGVAVYSAH